MATKNTETTREALEKEKAALEAERMALEAGKAALAEAKEHDPYDRVPIYVERPVSSQDDPNLFVSVNGKNFILPKGKTSMVPRYIYDEIMRSRAAAAHLDETVMQLKAKAQQPTAM